MEVLMGLTLTDLCGYRNLGRRRRKHNLKTVECTRKHVVIHEKKASKQVVGLAA